MGEREESPESQNETFTAPSAHVLVVDDEPPHRDSLRRIFERAGYAVTLADDGQQALRLVREKDIDLVLTDLVMPRMDGQTLLKAVKTVRPDVDVVLMTAYGTVENAVSAMREGAYDFITKPVRRNEVLACVSRAFERRALVVENAELRRRLLATERTGELIGNSDSMRRLVATLEQVAPSAASILLQGESGTGKEICARALHDLSARREQPFVIVNCAAIPDGILEDELFGPGDTKSGRLFAAHKGTLFLDEVSALPLAVQVKLLHALQDDTLGLDVRVVTASDEDLKARVQDGSFREDLFYRLNVIRIDVPSLRDRDGDVPLLAAFFLKRFSKRHQKSITQIQTAALDALAMWRFPGNVRELENAIERAVVLSPGTTLRVEDLPDDIRQAAPDAKVSGEVIHFRVGQTMEHLELAAIDATLRHTGGDKKLSAKLLGISLRTLYRRLDREDDAPIDDDDLPAGPPLVQAREQPTTSDENMS